MARGCSWASIESRTSSYQLTSTVSPHFTCLLFLTGIPLIRNTVRESEAADRGKCGFIWDTQASIRETAIGSSTVSLSWCSLLAISSASPRLYSLQVPLRVRAHQLCRLLRGTLSVDLNAVVVLPSVELSNTPAMSLQR